MMIKEDIKNLKILIKILNILINNVIILKRYNYFINTTEKM